MQLAFNVLQELWMVCTPKYQIELYLRQFQQIYRNPRTADVPCRQGYVFAFSFFLAEILKGRNSSSMLSTLMAAMHDLQRIENCTLWQSFTNLKESMYNDQRKTFIQHVSDAKGSSGWSACTIGTERVVLCDSLLYLQRIFQDTSYVCKPGCFSGLVGQRQTVSQF